MTEKQPIYLRIRAALSHYEERAGEPPPTLYLEQEIWEAMKAELEGEKIRPIDLRIDWDAPSFDGVPVSFEPPPEPGESNESNR